MLRVNVKTVFICGTVGTIFYLCLSMQWTRSSQQCTSLVLSDLTESPKHGCSDGQLNGGDTPEIENR